MERKTPIRIHLVIRPLAERSGGAERLYCELANMLAEAGFEVSCLYYDPKPGLPFYPLSPGVRLVNLHPGKSWVDRVSKGLARRYKRGRVLAPIDWVTKNGQFTTALIQQFREYKPDLVIAFMPPANTAALLAGRATGRRVVPTNHNVPEQDYCSKVRWDQNPLDRALRLHALRFAYRVHVLFEEFGRWFPADVRRKIVVVKNYVSDDFFAPAPDSPRRKVIVASGRLAPVKNYIALVDAWKELHADFPDWEVAIYGVGPQQRALEGRIAEHGLEGKVRLAGHASSIGEVYRQGEILCHPALFEGFGLSVAEALASGMPVVAFSDCAGVNQFVFHEVNGLMVNRAAGAVGLAGALRRLMTDDELRMKLRAAGPASVASFTRDTYLATWLDLIREATTPAAEPVQNRA